MQLAVVVTATATGVLLARVPRYRFVGTAALAAMIIGLVLLAQVGPHSSPWEVTWDIVIIGAGLGVTFPLTLVVVQPRRPAPAVGRPHEPDHVLAKPRRHDRHSCARRDPHQQLAEPTQPRRTGRHPARSVLDCGAGRGGVPGR